MNDLPKNLGPPMDSYTKHFTDEEITVLFEHKFGYPPEEIVRDGAIIKAGPIKGE